MPQRTITLNKRIDINKLFYPSFILPLFEIDVETGTLFKRWGYCRNLKIRRDDNNILVTHEERVCLDYVDEILGLWFDINRYRRNISRNYLELIDRIMEMHGELGIATSSNDDIEIFSSIFLSRITDFHRNTVRWLRSILSIHGSLDRILHLNNYNNIFKNISNSFQIRQLITALKDYIGVRDTVFRYRNYIYDVKNTLFKIKFVGPKVVYAYILFILKNTSYAPIDRNFLKFLKTFAITQTLIGRIPQKRWCATYICELCKYREECTLHKVRSVFGYMSGWFQTIAYLHIKTMCNIGKCNICKLKEICVSSQIY